MGTVCGAPKPPTGGDADDPSATLLHACEPGGMTVEVEDTLYQRWLPRLAIRWLGDDSIDHQATWDFLDRRIEDVMRIEKTKAKVRENPLLKRVFAGPERVLSNIRAPRSARESDLPGGWTAPR